MSDLRRKHPAMPELHELEAGVRGVHLPLPRFWWTEVCAIVASVIWAVVFALAWPVSALLAPVEPATEPLLVPIVLFVVPVAAIWLTAGLIRVMRQSRAMQRALQQKVPPLAAPQATTALNAEVTRLRAQISEVRTHVQFVMSRISADENVHDAEDSLPEDGEHHRPAAPDEPEEDETAAAAGGPLSFDEYASALNFPQSEDDLAGLRVLQRARQDPDTAQLIQAAEDVLTLLSQEGIYMDDLRIDRVHPDIWRRFAGGERGPSVSGIGAIRDRSVLSLAKGRVSQDMVFRDAALHFIRRFDHTFKTIEPQLTDAQVQQLSDTRTARAFMVLGRVSGTFDAPEPEDEAPES